MVFAYKDDLIKLQRKPFGHLAVAWDILIDLLVYRYTNSEITGIHTMCGVDGGDGREIQSLNSERFPTSQLG